MTAKAIAERPPSSPACGACEIALRLVAGKWVCCRPECSLYGREQLAVPDVPPRDKEQPPGGVTR